MKSCPCVVFVVVDAHKPFYLMLLIHEFRCSLGSSTEHVGCISGSVWDTFCTNLVPTILRMFNVLFSSCWIAFYASCAVPIVMPPGTHIYCSVPFQLTVPFVKQIAFHSGWLGETFRRYSGCRSPAPISSSSRFLVCPQRLP